MRQIFYIRSYIVLPIETLKKENYKSSYTPNSPKDIISNEYCSSFFTELEIGTPPQKIPFLVKMKTNDYVITSIHPMTKNASDYYINKTLYDFSENFLKNYDFFNENKSNTFSSKFCEDRNRKYKHDYEDEWPIAEETCSSYETVYFYENINMKNKKKENNLYFDLVRSIKDNITGIIGLSLSHDSRTQNCFLNILKKNNISENYYWFFDFDSPKKEKGKLVIGTTLDKIYKKEYSNKILNYAEGNQGTIFWSIKFDKIFIKENSSNIIQLKGSSNNELNFDTNVIIAPYEYREYFKMLINDLYIEGKCFNDTFYGCQDLYSSKGELIFFYCKNEKETLNELKKLILPIYFYSNKLNYTFEISNSDILQESGNYIFIKILFEKYGGYWNLGKPFALKYKFMLNPDIKEIGFYSKDFVKNKPFNKLLILIPVIIGLCIICAIVGVILGKKLYGLKRKKRANEMNDDDYEYFSDDKKKSKENDDKKNNNNYNNSLN